LREDAPANVEKYLKDIHDQLIPHSLLLLVDDVSDKVNIMPISFARYWLEILVSWQVIRMKLPNVFGISAKSDVAVRFPNFEGTEWMFGVLIGIEVKPEIVQHHITQCQVECLITAYNSYFPTLQVCFKFL
jgi:hypothetical protein